MNISTDIIEYIKAQEWGEGNNTNRGLMGMSINQKGINEILEKKIIDIGRDNISIYYNNGKLFRVFNLNQPKISKETILKYCNYEVINRTIESDNKGIQRAIRKAEILKMYIKNNTSHTLIKKEILEFIRLLLIRGSNIYFLEGLVVASQSNNDIIKKFSIWKNDNTYLQAVQAWATIYEYLISYYNIKVTPRDFNDFTDIDELINLLRGDITISEIEERILKRKKEGYLVLNLLNKKYVLNLQDAPNELKEYIEGLHKSTLAKKLNGNELHGRSVLEKDVRITCPCVIAKTELDVYPEMNLEGKFLVTTMTTPYIIPYALKAQGIVTDNGGTLCHAAIIARENNIPCIVGTGIATEVLKTGDIIEIDLKDGRIRILHTNEENNCNRLY